MVLKWATRLKSSAINQKRMIDNFVTDIQPSKSSYVHTNIPRAQKYISKKSENLMVQNFAQAV